MGVRCGVMLFLLLALYTPRESQGVKVAAFYVRAFGVAKAGHQYIMDILVKILDRYDITLLQGIRDGTGAAIVSLLQQLNSYSNHTYRLELSPRLGRGNTKEQYAFFYRNDSGIEVSASYMFDDGDEAVGNDTFEREPIVTQFIFNDTELDNLTIVGCRINSNDVVNEMNNFTDVIADVQAKLGTGDVLLMGAFYTDCLYITASERANLLLSHATYDWLVSDTADTFVAVPHCSYDSFITTSSTMSSRIDKGSVSVFLYDQAYGLNQTTAINASNHYPIELSLQPTRVFAGGRRLETHLLLLLPSLWSLLLLFTGRD